ncbi:MAG: Tad domain-containing protein [Nocardioides sp.]|nr:Tad domain-containing protein [Nocardioides sp.]
MSRPTSRPRDDLGSITPFVLIASVGILLLAGLIIDGGMQMNGRGRAVAYAQEAARAGAQAIDETDPNLELRANRARQAAHDFCRTAMAEDPELGKCAASTTSITDGTGSYKVVKVETEVTVETILLNMIGKETLSSSGSAIGRPVSGITGPDAVKVPTQGPSVALPSDGVTPSEDEDPDAVETVPDCPTITITPSDDGDKKGGKDKKDKKGDKGGKGKKDKKKPSPKPTVTVSCPTPVGP